MPGQFDIHPFNLAALQFLRVESTVRPVSRLIVSVTAGVLDVYMGEHTNPTGIPTWRFRANREPQEVRLLPLRQVGRTAILTLKSPRRATTGTVTFYGAEEED